MAECTAIILSAKQEGLFTRLDPGMLAAKNPIWKQDVGKFGPWRKNDSHPLIEEKGDCIWQAESCMEEHTVVICGQCTSSMDVAWHFIQKKKLRQWDSILAVEQTAGRGQHERSWTSPSGNIYSAWYWPYPSVSKSIDACWQGFISLIAGYLMAKIINDEYGLSIKIKWPNDLLLNGKKLGGLLTEVKSGHLVVGIGINLLFSPDTMALRDDFAVSATNLHDEGIDAKPLSLWMTLAEKGRMYFDQLTRSLTPEEFIEIFKPYLAWVGRKVLVRSYDHQVFEAVITGISQQGGLILQIGDQTKVIYTGSIIPL